MSRAAERTPASGAADTDLPEIGPLLGGLVTPTPEHVTTVPGLDEVRLGLVANVIERAGEARRSLAGGDGAGAERALGPESWLPPWERAVEAAAVRVMGEIEARLRDAALLSRLPRRRLTLALPSEEDRRVLAARLAATGIDLEDAVRRLAGAPESPASALRRLGGQQELAWAGLAAVVSAELALWEPRIAEVRAWRRPWGPFLAGVGLAAALAAWLGLVLGGYLPVPRWMRPLAEWAWSTGWL
ncbi:MAG: hypothetical protein ACRENB_01895 [Gemmatimonadales bacterium]